MDYLYLRYNTLEYRTTRRFIIPTFFEYQATTDPNMTNNGSLNVNLHVDKCIHIHAYSYHVFFKDFSDDFFLFFSIKHFSHIALLIVWNVLFIYVFLLHDITCVNMQIFFQNCSFLYVLIVRIFWLIRFSHRRFISIRMGEERLKSLNFLIMTDDLYATQVFEKAKSGPWNQFNQKH